MSSEEPHQESNPFAEMEVSPPNPYVPPTKPEENEAKLGRLHRLSLFFDITSHIRTFVIPAVIALLSAASGSVQGLFVAGFLFFPTLIASVIRYFSLRYRIAKEELVVTEGIFFRRNRTVPIKRIQNIDLMQNVMHRLFNVAEVRIETASGTEPEATLRVLSMDQVEELRSAIFSSRRNEVVSDLTNDEDSALATPIVQTQTLLTIPTNLLVRAGLASNRGTLLLGVLVGIYFQFDNQIEDYFDLNSVISWFKTQYDSATIVFLAVVAFVFLMFFFRLLGIAWYVLRFSGYRLTRTEEDLRIQCGLFTKISATVPRKRIQFISIHRNWLMRLMKLAAIRIETAGAAGAGKEDAAKSVSSRWFIPVLPEAQVKTLIEQLRPDLTWDEEKYDWKPVSPLAPKRMMRLAVVASVVVGIIGFAFTRPWGWLFGVAALPILVPLAIKKAHSRRYARTDQVILYRSGIFTKKTSLTFFEKIQTVLVSETPFDRRWNMATLCIDTAAAGPAEHLIHIGYLENEFARQEFDEIVKQSSERLPVFN